MQPLLAQGARVWDDDTGALRPRGRPVRRSEATIQAETMLAVGALDGVRLFRNSVGQGWVGKTVEQTETRLTLEFPRRVTFGLCVGSSDIIGLRTVTITQEMVGKRIAQFVGLEEKTPVGRLRPEQIAFMHAMRKLGALAEVSRDPAHAKLLLTTKFGQATLC